MSAPTVPAPPPARWPLPPPPRGGSLKPEPYYDIALRPDSAGDDPMDRRTRLDDICVRNVTLFRAEQMSADSWWVCCYLQSDDDMERITWSVRAVRGGISWTGNEYPVDDFIYEHEVKP